MCHPSRRVARLTLAVPIILVNAGVMMLMGCIYLPSSYRYQVNGEPRPESLVGHDATIVPGTSDIADALIATSSLVEPDWREWYVDPANRFVAVAYRLRTGGIYFPLCGWSPDYDESYRLIVFDVDERGTVTRVRTTAFETASPLQTAYAGTHPEAFFALVPASARVKLHAAGLLPDDATVARGADPNRAGRVDLKSPATRP